MKILFGGFTISLALALMPGAAEATTIHYEGKTSGQIINSGVGDGYISNSWISAGDKVRFNYTLDYSDYTGVSRFVIWLEVQGQNGFIINDDYRMNSNFDEQTRYYHDSDFDQPILLGLGITPQLIDPNWSIGAWDGYFDVNGYLGGSWNVGLDVDAYIYDEFGNRVANGSYGFYFTSEPVPEPSTLALLSFGALTLTTRIRRMKRSIDREKA